jgi:multisubunit Na+/H+ antiporter MnhB subunit
MEYQRSSRQYQWLTVAVFLFALLFLAFFDRSKHDPALAAVNPFVEDPYDAVGSFAIQLTTFAALLSLFRAFRPHTAQELTSSRFALILRGVALVLLSVLETLASDMIGMLRFPALWMGSTAGWILAGLIGGIALLAAGIGLWTYCVARGLELSSPRGSWRQGLIFPLASIIILALYPQSWRESIPGAIITALVGMALLFLSVWGLGKAIFPKLDHPYADFIDDLAATAQWVKAHAGYFAGLFAFFEIVTTSSLTKGILSWLNPRKHAWNLILCAAVAMGIVLALVEALGEGAPADLGRLALVAAVFIGIEGVGVFLGYVLLGRFLGLYRLEG